MRAVEALQTTDITKIGIGVIVALVVLGLIASLIITAIVGRLIILIIVVALGIFVWTQRTSVENKIDNFKSGHVASCQFDKTFFGIHVKAPASLVSECEKNIKT